MATTKRSATALEKARKYRALAAEQRNKADAANLPAVRKRYMIAAKRWDIMANEAESIAVLDPRDDAQDVFS